MPENSFKWKHYEGEIILLNVRWYLKYALSYRNLKEMMIEKGIQFDHSAMVRWVHRYSPNIEKKIRKHFIGHRLRSYFRLHLLFFESDSIISYSNHSSLNLSLFTCGSNA